MFYNLFITCILGDILMLFKFKKKKITLDCFTNNAGAMLTPPDHGAKFFPSWWKSLKPAIPNPEKNGIGIKVPTLKRCPGFVSYYTSGIVVPMWADLHIETHGNGNYRWQYSMGSMTQQLSSHPSVQHDNMMPGWFNLKIAAPWIFNEKTGIKWVMGNAFWHDPSQDDYVVPNAVLDFKYQGTVNVNTMVRDEKRSWLIKHNTPMLHLIPLVEDNVKVEVKTHEISNEEYNKMYDKFCMHKFIGSYNERKKNGWDLWT